MDMQPADILDRIDRLVESANEQDLRLNLDGFRQTLEGRPASVVIKRLFVAQRAGEPAARGAGASDAEAFVNDTIQYLQGRINALTSDNAGLELQVNALALQLRDFAHAAEPPKDGAFSMGYFLAKLVVKMRRSYGWRTDYIAATRDTPGCDPVSNEMLQGWRNNNKVPQWAVEQIDRLDFRERKGASGHSWSSDDERFLVNEYSNNPGITNSELAARCTARFGWPVNENMVKGAIDRARKKELLPKKRQPRRGPA